MAGEGRAALGAATLWVEAIVEELVPVADDQWLSAGGAIGGIALGVVDIADIDVLEPCRLGLV